MRILDKNIVTQERGLYKLPSPSTIQGENKRGGSVVSNNEWQSIPSEKGNQQKLSDPEILELSELIVKIEKHYGFPCDIEWAREGGKFYIVQSRPITTLAKDTSSVIPGQKIWVENFSATQISFQVLAVAWDYGIKNCQAILFGKNQPLIATEYFGYMKGLDLKGGYFLKNEVNELAERVCEAIYTDPEKIERIHQETYTHNDRYFSFMKKCIAVDLHQLHDKQLGKLYTTLTKLQEKAHQHALTTTWFVDSTDQIFSERLIAETKNIVKESGSTRKPLDVFTLLTTSTKESFTLIEELEFLKILKQVQAHKESREVLARLSDYAVIPKELPLKITKALQKHYEKWHWMPYKYLGPAYGLDYYLSVLSGLVRERIDATQEIKEKKKQLAATKKERERLFQELHISSLMRRIYDIAADITFLKGYRKDCVYYGMYFIDQLFREMKDRIGVESLDMHYLTYLEIEDIFVHGKKVDREEITRRKDCSIMYHDHGVLKVLSGQAAKKFFQNLNIEKEVVDYSESVLKGTCACSGFATGAVKIVNRPEEMGKMNDGDVMVSHTTFPSLVPAMKKAAAIVTEDGGITCHAAIVARELKTPCVTGIKTATQVLHDGDIVEVDANEGVVRILERAGENRKVKTAKDEVFDVLERHTLLVEAGREMYLWAHAVCHHQYWNTDKDWPLNLARTEVVSISKNRLVKWYFAIQDEDEFLPYLERFVKDPLLLKKLRLYILRTRRKTIARLKKLSPKISQKKLEELAGFFYHQAALLLRAAGTCRYLDRALLRRFPKIFDKDGNADEMIRTLAVPSQLSFSMVEEVALLKLAHQLKQHKLSLRSPLARDGLKKIHNQYAWTAMGYGTEKLRSLTEYTASVREMMRQDPKVVLDELQTKHKRDLTLREKTMKRLNRKTRQLADIAAASAYLKDLFKFSMNEIIYRAEPLFDQITKRTKRKQEFLKDLIPDDVLALLRGEKIDEKQARERMKEHILISYGEEKFAVFEGEAAQELEKRFLTVEKNNGQKEFRGRVASPGLARGKVKVVLSLADFNKFETGDILVATNTSPDFVPLMKKSAAIAAEEGGLTAHVSVVSREFGIPCIVGLNHITQILKDGDLVEVNAEHGIVKILESARS